MTFLKNVWADLVEKRLWPLVVVLALALVAVPVVLARGGASTPAPPPLPPAPATASAVPAAKPIKVVEPTPTRAPHGRYRDPFAGHGTGKAASASSGSSSSSAPSTSASSTGASSSSSSSASASSSSPTASAGSPASSGSSSSGPSTTSKPSPTVSQPAPTGYAAGYRVGVGFGPAGNVEPAKDILRLHPMGADGKTPLIIFVGMLADGKTAMFLLDANADATGDGRCWPTKVTCQLLELHKGDAEFFDVPTGQSGVVQYELDVNTIVKRYTATSVGAYHVRKRESASGRKAMKAVIKAGHTYVTHLVYSAKKGVLFMPRRTGKTGGPSA